MASDPTFSILISTKNRREDLLFTLNKIDGLLQRSHVDCVVFDDGSTDNTFRAVQQDFPHVRLLRNETSKGYLFCRNAMLNETKTDFAISLDDDAHFLSDHTLEAIEEHFSANRSCGLIAFRIFWGKEAPDDFQTSEKSQQVKAFVGCGHVWRMKAWHEIADYPEWFQFYGEENAASLELYKKHWRVDYVPQILVQHRVDMKARNGQKDFAFRYRRSLRADWYLYFLYYPPAKIPRILAYSVWMQLKKIFKGNFRVFGPLFLALSDVFLAIPKFFRFRNALTLNEYTDYQKLPQPKIYWKPEK